MAVISVLSGVQFAFRASPAAAPLIALDMAQAVLGIAVVVAMRTSLRRYPEAVSLAFLTIVPIVPLTTLHVQPDSVVLVAASLALLPIGVALFFAWSHATYLSWSVGFLAVVMISALSPLEVLHAQQRWETTAVVMIGLLFGLVGQRRRTRQERLAFDRERDLARLLAESDARQAHARLAAKRARAAVETTIREGSFRSVFQPIADLRTGAVLGYEALSRFADGTRPDVMFELATTAGLSVELESATLRAALSEAASLPAGLFVGLNISPEMLDGPDVQSMLGGYPRPVVLEITEHVAIDDYELVRAVVEALGGNVTMAVDDAGAGYASFRHILELAPGKVKIDIGLVRGIDADPARQALIAGLVYFAVQRGIELIAEGIETPAELTTLRSLGVTQGQGYLLGRPSDGISAGPWPSRINVVDLLAPGDGTLR